MDYLESVRELLTEHLQGTLVNTKEVDNWVLMVNQEGFIRRVYDAFYNLVADPTQSPESIMHHLDTYTSGLEGFSTNNCIQILVGFACFDALTIRNLTALVGPWETLVWIIVKYVSFYITKTGKSVTMLIRYYVDPIAFATDNYKSIQDWITKFAWKELCPNPYLRLELFRFMRVFYVYSNRLYDHNSLCDTIIYTLFELSDDNIPLTINEVPNFSQRDLQLVMKDNSIDMKALLNFYDQNSIKSEIIAKVLNLTRHFALLVKEKHQEHNSYDNWPDYKWHDNLKEELSACLSFCGLIPEIAYNELGHNECLMLLLQAVGKNSILLSDMIDTLETIDYVLFYFPNENGFLDSVIQEKDELLRRIFKGHINRLPKHQYLHEMHGCSFPATEYHLRNIQNYSMDQYYDSDYDSENFDYEDENNTRPDDFEGNESDTSISNEERSAVIAYRNEFPDEEEITEDI